MTKRLRYLSVFVFALFLISGHEANAAQLTVNSEVTARIDNLLDLNFLAVPDLSMDFGEPILLFVDFFMQIGDLNVGETGFGNLAMNINLSSGVTDSGFGWIPNNPSVDLPPAGPINNPPRFADNSDFGDPTDLVGIVVGIDSGLTDITDPRVNVGLGSPSLIGSIIVEWDGFGPDFITVTPDQFSTNNGGQLVVSDGSFTGNTQVLGVPEPSSLVLCTIGLAVLLPTIVSRRRGLRTQTR